MAPAPGWRPAGVLLGCLVGQMGLGCAYMFAATLKHVVSEFEWSRTVFAAGASAPLLLAMAASSPFVGGLTQRIGPRPVMVAATLLLGLVLAGMSRMQEIWHFYLLSAAFGVALTGVGDIPVGTVVARWFERRRGLALGIVYVGSNIGGALVPLFVTAVAAWYSWRTALWLLGLLAVVVILPSVIGLVRMPGPGERAGREPAGAPADRAAREDDLDLAAALRTRSFWILVLALLTFYFYYLGVNQHLIAFLSDRGFSDAQAAARFGGAVGLGVVAKLAIGVLADRIPGKRALLLNFGLLSAGSLALLAVDEPGLLLVFLVAHGFATAAENVLLPLIVVDCFGVRHMPRIYGALMLTLFPGGVLGPVFAGAVFDRTGDYRIAFTSFALLNLLGLAALCGLRCERPAARARVVP